ncbi:hypothetical protein F66182_7513 [Fusarium sp. NRRL 66182]|nr:hypothetical protein F66182_7513 [Fusarium sp. NRRL 66182]
MHSAIFALVAISGLASAGPTKEHHKAQVECQGTGSYYVCANNGFRGYCRSDPCAVAWCPDYVPKTCDPYFVTEPEEGDDDQWEPQEEEHDDHWKPKPSPPTKKLPDGQCESGTGYFQSCSNGFRGCCTKDACGSSWCPDYKTGTYEPVKKHHKVKARGNDPTVCAPGTGFFQSCSNGFRGCCKGDACGSSWCPDYKTGTYEPKGHPETWKPKTEKPKTVKPESTSSDPTVCAPGTGFFQSCSNGFRGCCKGDACGSSWCPDYKTGTYEPVNHHHARQSDSTVCPPNTGYFQSCSNGFRGCCKGDACGSTWCPDYKTGTYKPKNTLKVTARQADPTVCAPGTGFFQSCSNGFRGCCKKDACGQKTPVCPQ